MAPRSLDLRSLRIDMKSLADRLLESPLVETDVTPSFFITGNHPTREVDPAERGGEPMWVVHFPRGFETLDVAVLGHGLCDADVIAAAMEFLNAEHPESLTAEERDAAFPDEHGIAVTPPSRGSFQEGRRRPVMLKEASMSYCAFENTATDMAQVVGMIKNIIRSDDPAAEFKAHFNKYELRGMSSLKQLCRQYLEDVARMEAEVKDAADDHDTGYDHDMGGDFPPERD